MRLLSQTAAPPRSINENLLFDRPRQGVRDTCIRGRARVKRHSRPLDNGAWKTPGFGTFRRTTAHRSSAPLKHHEAIARQRRNWVPDQPARQRTMRCMNGWRTRVVRMAKEADVAPNEKPHAGQSIQLTPCRPATPRIVRTEALISTAASLPLRSTRGTTEARTTWGISRLTTNTGLYSVENKCTAVPRGRKRRCTC